MEKIVSAFLACLGIPISKRYVQNLVLSHPDFPSLLSVSDTLQRLGIEHAAVRIKKEELIDLPLPYLLPIEKGMGNNMLLIKTNNDLRKYESDLKFWNGVVLQADKTKHTRDQINNELYGKETRIKGFSFGLVAILLSLFFTLGYNSFDWQLIGLLLTSVLGVIVGYFLVAKDIGVNYNAVDAFCNAGKNNKCDKVLESGTKVWGISLSDAAFTYFIFQTIVLCLLLTLPEAHQYSLQVLAILSSWTVPIILFSLFYQYFIAKTWCKLCLVVVGILLVQFALFLIIYFTGSISLVVNSLLFFYAIELALLFIGIGLCEKWVKTIVERENQLNKSSIGNRIKHSIPVFTHLFKKQKQVEIKPFSKEILIGHPDASIKIVMVSNLYCKPCKEQHKFVDQLISMYPDKVNVALRFIPSGNETDKKMESVKYLLGYWLTNISCSENENDRTMKLLHEWFLHRNLKKFIEKHPFKQSSELEIKQLEEQHYIWARRAGITFTPTFFLNGRQLPSDYNLEDVVAMVSGLVDTTIEDNKNEIALQH
jgi:Vitamin K epoxide reductase family/Thioredoxin